MQKDYNLLFLQNKIREIKLARFSAEMDSELQLPNNIVCTIKTDGYGNIWFFTSCKGLYSTQYDKHFFASLDFYQKGYDYRLKLTGDAWIVEDDYKTDDAVKGVEAGVVLIKFKILHAEYADLKPIASVSVKEKIKTIFSNLFISNAHKEYDFT